ncbi:MAG: hypothetical protein LC744_05375 [Chloroflexi bacterium]|nr:hypothetical protein [Chloroflexota bacterium]
MHRWLTEAAAAARVVSDRPQLWVAGGLAWAATVGPLALLVAVVPAPNVSDLTFLGARVFVAAAWPWNAVALAILAALAVLLALALVSVADAFLLRGGESVAPWSGVARAFAVSVVAALPVLVVAGSTGLVLAGVAPGEFTAPDTSDGGPVVRTLLIVGPLLGLLFAAVVTAGAWATAARVLALRRRAALGRALAGAIPLLAAATPASAIQALVAPAARLAYLVLATLLLGVLWAPIGEELASGAGFGAAQGALLVGFVAIWLCLVLGGGALHAWGSVSWTRILAVRSPSVERGDALSKETPSTP